MNHSDIAGFSAAITQALHSLSSNGRLKRNAIHSLLRAIHEISKTSRFNISFEPEKYLGSFDSLPLHAQNAIVQTIANEDKWCMLGHEIGDWHIMMARLFAKLRRRFSRYRLDRLSKIAQLLAIIAQSGPAHLLHIMYKLQMSWQGKFSLHPTLPAILKKLKIEPWDLAVCYAQHIPQPEAYRGFYHEASRHNTYSVILGIDLLPTTEGYWYIESNLNFGMSYTRTSLYDSDPFVANLIEFASKQGYRHVVVVSNTSSYMNKVMAKQFEEMAEAHKIKLTIVEDAYLPKSGYIQSFAVPSLAEDDTLIVRTKFYRTSLDHLFQNKRASYRALETYKQYSSDPELLLPATSAEPILNNVSKDDPFPNLVYKLPERDEGKGSIFLKAKSPGHAQRLLNEAIVLNHAQGLTDRLYSLIEDNKGIYQSYIKSPLLNGRRLYKIRAHVLISPIGAEFLSAHRVISGFMVPEHLPFGVVKDSRPYLVNLSSSSEYEILSLEEESAVVKSALSVAKGLAWAASYGFQSVDT